MKGIEGLQLPAGMRDLLPGEAKYRRRLEDILVRKFLAWGYQETITPVLEFYENLLSSGVPPEQLFKLIDRQGQILALRPDMTTPIARMVSAKIDPESFPRRIFYAASVFRHESPQMGRQREFFQAGVELIGEAGVAGDAEVIALAVEAMHGVGLRGFQLSVGEVAFLKGVVSRLDLAESVQEAVIAAIYGKDFVQLEMLLAAHGVQPKEKALLLSLPSLRGGIEVLTKAARMTSGTAASAALERLREVFSLLQVYGVVENVFIDFGIVRDFDYYSGMVFEGYCPGLGAPVCGGGRYDGLLSRFGMDAPATGFAIGLERLAIALDHQGLPENIPEVDYLIVSENHPAAIQKAQELRCQGFSVQTATGLGKISPGVGRIIEL